MKQSITFFLILLLSMFQSCSPKKIAKETKPVSVRMTKVESRTVPYYISTVGHIEAYQTVPILAQIDGQLLKTYFKDGDDIKKGDLLYLIDQRPYLSKLELAEGELKENIANRDYAKRNAERNASLVADEYISQNDYDRLLSTLEADDGLVQQSQADVETAKINLGFTTIYSPLNARAGFSLMKDGSIIIKAAENTLVTLNQISPIYASFFINGNDLPKLQRYQKKNGTLKVIVSVNDPETPDYTGDLTFIDNNIDLATGMINLKATFLNEDKNLWPHQYIKVKLILDMMENVTLVPMEAVEENSTGPFVYVIKGNQTVEMRYVTLGEKQEDNMIVIEKGLKEAEKVVTEGQFNLKSGVKVHVIEKNG